MPPGTLCPGLGSRLGGGLHGRNRGFRSVSLIKAGLELELFFGRSILPTIFPHPRTSILSLAVTSFRVGSALDKTNGGFLYPRPPTRSRPRLGGLVALHGGAMRRSRAITKKRNV